ncbi:hypothetical protein AgCh_028597 [Apium graveolens]
MGRPVHLKLAPLIEDKLKIYCLRKGTVALFQGIDLSTLDYKELSLDFVNHASVLIDKVGGLGWRRRGSYKDDPISLLSFATDLTSRATPSCSGSSDEMRDLPPIPKNRKCFQTIDRHRLIPIFKEEIEDPKFFYPIQKVFSAGRLVGGEKGPYSVPHSVLLSALPGNIYLHKLDQEIGRIRQKYEIPIVQIIRSVLLKTGRIDDQENSGEEASFNAPQDNRAFIVGKVKSIQHKAAFHSLISSWNIPPPPSSGGIENAFRFPPFVGPCRPP